MDSALRPRDIQARIRAGETPERVASAAGTTVERIMGFATPVLAERAWMAQQAQRASVRRRTGAGPGTHLGDAVEAHLADRRLDADEVGWDAWRREDGRWTVVASVPGEEPATFTYDTAGRYVVAEDDASRLLVGERLPSPPPGAEQQDHQPTDEATGSQAAEHDPREPAGSSGRVDRGSWAALGAVPEVTGPGGPRIGDQVELGDDALDVVAGSARRTEEPAATLFEVDAAASEPSTGHSVPSGSAGAATADDLMVDDPGVGDAGVDDTGVDDTGEDDTGEGDPGQGTGAGAAAEDADDARRATRTDRSRRGKSRRASVPSWDEIMFGSGKAD